MRAIHSFNSRRENEEGFTLIELMVVVLIIAILIAIAIPTFLSARKSAQNRAAQSDLRNAFAAAKTFYTDEETYVGFDAAEAEAREPSLEYNDAGGTTDEVGITGATDSVINLTKESKSGQFYALCDDISAGTEYGEGDSAANAVAACAPDGW